MNRYGLSNFIMVDNTLYECKTFFETSCFTIKSLSNIKVTAMAANDILVSNINSHVTKIRIPLPDTTNLFGTIIPITFKEYEFELDMRLLNHLARRCINGAISV